MLKAYGTLLRTPGALKFSTAGFIGRMPIAMDSLAIIFVVVAATDSYALAGALTAVGSIAGSFPTFVLSDNNKGIKAWNNDSFGVMAMDEVCRGF